MDATGVTSRANESQSLPVTDELGLDKMANTLVPAQ